MKSIGASIEMEIKSIFGFDERKIFRRRIEERRRIYQCIGGGIITFRIITILRDRLAATG